MTAHDSGPGSAPHAIRPLPLGEPADADPDPGPHLRLGRLAMEPSDPAWPALASASLTVIAGQKDRCLILPNSAQFVSEREDLGGAQRLAVMAVDFSRWSLRSAAGAVSPCAAHGEHRPRPSLLSSQDVEDRQRIAQALLRLGGGSGGRKRPRAGHWH